MALVASLLTFAPTPANAVAPTCAQGGVCQVGDIGPGGGIVYFVATTPFACGPDLATTCLYLEVAPKNWGGGSADPTHYWNDTFGEVVSGISRDASPNMDVSQIGLGLKNSNLMAAADPSTGNAAVAARGYGGGSKNNWYLPTLAELRLLCQYAYGQTRALATACDYAQTFNNGVPSTHTFSSTSYQSSSQSSDAGNAQWHANFISGSDGNTAEQSTWGYTSTLYATRPIRAFAQETFACGTSGTFTKIGNEVTTSSNCVGSVNIPEGVTVIADSAFYGKNAALTALTLPTTLVTISDNAFRVAGSIPTLNIPANVVTIGERAFSLNTAPLLTTLTFSAGSKLQWIKSFAFEYSAFTSVTIPSSVTTIGQYAFVSNTSLSQINFLGSIPSGSPWSAPVGTTVSKVVCDGSTRTCEVGENGPGGGTIYYYSSGGFDCGPTQSDTCNYLEVAPSGWNGASDPTRVWALDPTSNWNRIIPGVTSQDTGLLSAEAIGLGYKDSVAMVNYGSDTTTATGAARAYSGGSKNDWYLPSPAELNLLCQWARGVAPSITTTCTGGTLNSTTYGAGSAGLSGDRYWSSTQSSGYQSYAQGWNLSTGAVSSALKNALVRVRPIRAFGSGPAVISVAAIGGVTAPVSGATPVTSVTSANGYTGTITWSGSPTTFAPSETYTATITLTPASGYTLTGVTANFFTISGATAVTHNANSGIITAVFPATAIAAPAFTLSSSSETATVGTAITGFTINSTGGTIASYSISPAISDTPGLSFSTSTGLITGTPTTAATSKTYTITATNATSPSATRTFAITVSSPPTPTATISTTTFTTGAAAIIGVSLTNFDQNLNYQATVKFVHPTSNVDVGNGTLTATQGSTSLISGYDSYSGSKLGFTGSYAAITAALASITWNPLVPGTGMKLRIGISTAPGANEFYDANSGHYYRFVSSGLDAITARTTAEQSVMFGLRGYLVEINSRAENDFVGRETSATNIWIGASDRTTEGAFIWDGAPDTVTYSAPTGSGSSARGSGAFSSWASGEPNDHPWDPAAAPELEDCVLTNWNGSRGMWNDYPCRQVLSYLIEYGGRPNETSTAVSATLTATVNAVNPPTFNVIYNKNGATGAPSRGSDRYITGRTEITLSGVGSMTKAGQTFAGWSISGLAPVITGTYAPSSNVTLKAVWTPTSYTITYDPNGGSEPPTQVSRTMGQTFTLAAATTRATSNGVTYQFAFWRSGSTSFRAGTTITVGTSNLTFTAVWVEEFEVTYSANGGAFAGTDTEKDNQCVGAGNKCSNNQAITLNDDPTRTGFTFAGWQTPGGIAVSDSTPGTLGVQTTVTSSNYIFIATWTAVDYTVTYVSDGSTAPTETAKNIGQIFEVADEATKANHEFAGWSDGNSTYWPDSIYLVGTSNITLTALWSAFYTVTYSEGLGSGTPPTDADTYRTGDGFELLSGIGIERSNFAFNGWSDGTTTYQPTEIYTVGTSNLTLTAQWVPVYTISYTQDRGPAGGTPPTEYLSYRTGNTFTVLSGSTLTNPGFTFTGWNDGTRTFQAGATYTVGSSNVTFAAQWTAITAAPTPAPVVVGPPPSVIKAITAPKISRSTTHYICTPGTYVFVRNGVSDEAPKLTSQTYSLLQDGKVVDSITSALAEVKFEIKSSYMNSTMSCAVQVGQENLLSTVSSISSKVIAEANQSKRADLDRVEAQYVADRTAAYANKDKEFARLEALKKTEMASAKSSAAILLVSAKYRKAFTAATDLWKVELKTATTNRDAGRLAAQATYLKTLETAGASIYPQEAKAVVTPTPTPSVIPKPTPSPTQTTNPQPTSQMEKVGTVYMASGSYFLNDATKLTLRALALKINASGAKSILVYGHTDNRGGVNNTVLSQNRAKTVANYLRPLLTVKKISIGWYASKKPVAGGTSAAALALNRRVEIYTK